MLSSDNYCVIMAGGAGTRLWPLSRKGLPKQFIDFTGDGSTLLKQAYERMSAIFLKENIIVSTNIDYYQETIKQLPQLDPKQILREPVMKGTAPSLIMSAFFIRDLNAGAKVLVVPSDIRIMDEEPYREVVEKGMDFVTSNDKILTVGISPTRPETRFGYIQIDDEQKEGMFKVRTFTEKPEEEFAKVFVESGEFYWNSGMLMWNVEAFIDTANLFLPDIVEPIRMIFDTCHDRDTRRNDMYTCYEGFPHASIDYAVLEKAENVYMIRSFFNWNDIESWDLLFDVSAKDSDNNVLRVENRLIYNCRNNLVIENNNNKLVVIDDISDYLVVDTEDALVICRRDNESAFKKYVKESKLLFGDKFV